MMLMMMTSADECHARSRRFGANSYRQTPFAVWKVLKSNSPCDFACQLATLRIVIDILTADSATSFHGILEFDPLVPAASVFH